LSSAPAESLDPDLNVVKKGRMYSKKKENKDPLSSRGDSHNPPAVVL
jgi:hypothetical protein